MDIISEVPAGASHTLPRLPRPAVWISAIKTSPSGASSLALRRSSVLVDSISETHSTLLNRVSRKSVIGLRST